MILDFYIEEPVGKRRHLYIMIMRFSSTLDRFIKALYKPETTSNYFRNKVDSQVLKIIKLGAIL